VLEHGFVPNSIIFKTDAQMFIIIPILYEFVHAIVSWLPGVVGSCDGPNSFENTNKPGDEFLEKLYLPYDLVLPNTVLLFKLLDHDFAEL
jgi:hypothetical protein